MSATTTTQSLQRGRSVLVQPRSGHVTSSPSPSRSPSLVVSQAIATATSSNVEEAIKGREGHVARHVARQISLLRETAGAIIVKDIRVIARALQRGEKLPERFWADRLATMVQCIRQLQPEPGKDRGLHTIAFTLIREKLANPQSKQLKFIAASIEAAMEHSSQARRTYCEQQAHLLQLRINRCMKPKLTKFVGKSITNKSLISACWTEIVLDAVKVVSESGIHKGMVGDITYMCLRAWVKEIEAVAQG